MNSQKQFATQNIALLTVGYLFLGIHGESATFKTLLGLFLWNEIYDSNLPDVFINNFQSVPLDVYTDQFYINRKDAIDSKLLTIKNANQQVIIIFCNVLFCI